LYWRTEHITGTAGGIHYRLRRARRRQHRPHYLPSPSGTHLHHLTLPYPFAPLPPASSAATLQHGLLLTLHTAPAHVHSPCTAHLHTLFCTYYAIFAMAPCLLAFSTDFVLPAQLLCSIFSPAGVFEPPATLHTYRWALPTPFQTQNDGRAGRRLRGNVKVCI